MYTVDNPVTEYLYKGAISLAALLMGTWAWFLRHVFMKRLDEMEKRISDLEKNTLSKSDIRAMERELRAAANKIEADVARHNQAIFEKIERTEDKIEGAHDRILNQLKGMIDLLNLNHRV